MRRLRRPAFGRRSKIGLAILAALAVLLVFNTISVNSETDLATADVGRILRLPGPDLQVREDGSRDSPPMVLIHGYTGSLHWFDAITPILARRFHVIRIDLLGHGGSDKPASGYSMQNQAQLVALVLGRLNLENAVVVGHSMGGAVATALAARHSELAGRVVIIDEDPNNQYTNTPFIAKLSFLPVLGQALSRVTPDGAVRSAYEDAFAKGYSVPDFAVRGFRAMTYTSFKASEKSDGGEEDYLEKDPLPGTLAAAGIPVEVIFGADDRVVDPKAAEAFRDVPGVRIAVVAGAGHSPQVEKPERTARLILEFAREAGDEEAGKEAPPSAERRRRPRR